MKQAGKVNKSVKTVIRRKAVIERLEKQLLSGKKNDKITKDIQDLLDKDVTRITKEIETLKSRI